jgi:hypothetical protein
MGGTWLPICIIRIIGISYPKLVNQDVRRIFIYLDKLQGVFVFVVTMWTRQHRNTLVKLISRVFGAFRVANTETSPQNESSEQHTSSTNVSSTAL